MKNILITGIRGFIGFNAIQLWKRTRPDLNFFGLDADTYADKVFGELKRPWLNDNGVETSVVDLSWKSANMMLTDYIKERSIDTIVHFAAESHVDRSIKNPNVFFESNIIGTATIMNVARDLDLRVHVVSTDEVYGETRPESWENVKNAEDQIIVPSSPYSSSKASADMIALSYGRTFGTKVTVSRCTNNAGKFQHPEKLIGTIISKTIKNENIPVYGNGLQRRHWISVDDHNEAIMWILENGEIGKIYNIGPSHENWITNMDLIKFILEYLGKPESLISHVTDRLGHDTSYYLPSHGFNFKTKSYREFMPEIIDWYVKNI